MLLQRTRLPDVALHRGDLDSTIWVSGDNEGNAHSVTFLDNSAVVHTQGVEQQTHTVGVTTKTPVPRRCRKLFCSWFQSNSLLLAATTTDTVQQQ